MPSTTSGDPSGSADVSTEEEGGPSSNTNEPDTGTSTTSTTADTSTSTSQTSASSDETAGTPDCPRAHLRVFVSSEPVDGSITPADCRMLPDGPLERADCICQTLASSTLNDAGTFQAWISTDQSPVNKRLAPERGRGELPFCLVDGTLIAHDWTELIDPDAPLVNPIRLSETGQPVEAFTWTGTDAAGAAASATCGAWTGAGTGERGWTTETSSAWTHGATSGCGNSLRLYCFER